MVTFFALLAHKITSSIIDIMNTNYYRSRLALFRPICVEKPRPSPGYAYVSRLDRTKNCGVYPL